MSDLVETRQNELKRKKICRFCLAQDDVELTSIYVRDGRSKTTPLPLQVMACVSIEVFANDCMPPYICHECRVMFDYCYRFKQMCKKADNCLRHYPVTGIWYTPMEKPRIPPELVKNLKFEQKDETSSPTERSTLQIQRVKNDGELENGDILTEHLTDIDPTQSQQEHEQEEEIQEILEQDPEINSKSELAKAKPKSSGKKPPTEKPSQKLLNKSAIRILNKEANRFFEPRMTKPIVKRDNDGNIAIVTEILDLNDNMSAPDPVESAAVVETHVFPCPHCERSFPLRQLLEIHLVNHNRARSFNCYKCEKSFFSKYDLQKHMLVHTGEKPYKCVVCEKGFTRATLLYRHEKIHTDIPKFICVFCEKPFISQAEMEKHTERHRKNRPFLCKICNKAFAFKQGLERHENVHCRFQPYQCQYCDLSFSTPSKLSRHLTAHAGERPYPCKLCPKSYLLSHHLTRHLRSHKNGTGSYKCNECDKVFSSRDDLIYHSAVHATQTLVCPLCKDSFDDLKTVSNHVKQHADGEAYACEFCDLMYMSADRLQDHTNIEHGDEMMAYNEDEDAKDQESNNDKANGSESKKDASSGETTKTSNESRDFEVIEEFLVDELSEAGGESGIIIKEEVPWQNQMQPANVEDVENDVTEEEVEYMSLIEMNDTVDEPPLKISKVTSTSTPQMMKKSPPATTPPVRKIPAKPVSLQTSSLSSPKVNRKPLMKAHPLSQIKIEPVSGDSTAPKTFQAALKALPRSVSIKKVAPTSQNDTEPKPIQNKPIATGPVSKRFEPASSQSDPRFLRQRSNTTPNVKSPTKTPSPSNPAPADSKKPTPPKSVEVPSIKKLAPEQVDKKIVEMMIGDKKVKVQKITMSKAQAAAMAREGRIQMKEGTMILKKAAPKKPN